MGCRRAVRRSRGWLGGKRLAIARAILSTVSLKKFRSWARPIFAFPTLSWRLDGWSIARMACMSRPFVRFFPRLYVSISTVFIFYFLFFSFPFFPSFVVRTLFYFFFFFFVDFLYSFLFTFLFFVLLLFRSFSSYVLFLCILSFYFSSYFDFFCCSIFLS